MIQGIINPGSGLGDQLFSYIVTRVVALDKGMKFGFLGKEYFKGKTFLDLDWGVDLSTEYTIEQGAGALIPDGEVFTPNQIYYNPEINFLEYGAIIDGYGAQDIRYFEHRLDEIREWLKVQPMLMPTDLCVINFRGGEFATVPELFLTEDYWDLAIGLMLKKNPKMKFEVHTDDVQLASQFFPRFPIVSGIDLNWRSVRYARNLIISNSAFAIIPALLGGNNVIAPRYWARRNTKEWAMPSNYYKQFKYI